MAKLWRDPSPYRDRARAVAGDVTSPEPRAWTPDPRRRSPRRRARSCTAPRRSRSTCRSTRRADQRRGHARDHRASRARPSTRAHGPLRPRLDRVRRRDHRGHVPRAPARRRPGVPQHLRADEVGGRARRQRRVGPQPRDRAPVDRDGRVGLGLDAGLQRPVLADPRVLARAVRRGSGAARGAGRRRARGLRRRRARAPARAPVGHGRREPRLRSARPAPSTSSSR